MKKTLSIILAILIIVTTIPMAFAADDYAVVATVTDGTNTYYAADAATLNQAVTAILETGSRTFTVELPADAEAGMITAIRRAICDTEGVADGSINLTLKGVTSIPGTTNWDGVAFGPRNAQWDENNVEIVSHEEVIQLASVNLPDVTEIGAQAFYVCENLVSVSAPKAQTIGENAFAYTALTSVEFPELTAIPGTMLGGTWTLSSAKFPKVTTIEQNGLMIGFGFAPENNPTAFPLELTAEGDITFNGSNHFNIADQNYSGKVDLVLNIDKKDQVTFNDDGTATWQVRDDLSYTFKSITFTCTHSFTKYEVTEEAKCGVEGKEVAACDNGCGEIDEKTIEALRHSFTKYEETEAPKCGIEGKKVAVCDNGCGATDEKAIEALKHDIVIDEAVAPKCGESGLTQGEHCTRCDYKVEQEVVPALKHSFTKYEVTEAPKCGVEGKEVATCDHGCGATDEKAIAALTHKDADGDYKCDNGCGHEFEKPAPEDPTPDTPDEPSDDACDHLCHKGGFMGFIWKIVQFFWKLFKMNPICSCGVAHY